MLLMDFAVIQRDNDGYGRAEFCGSLPKELPENPEVYARGVQEDDNMVLSSWLKCDIDTEKGEWRILLTLPQGGLYRVEAVIASNGVVNEWCNRIKCLYHIGVGDVWLASGQSNMTGYGRDAAFDPPTLGVHALGNDGKWCIAVHPLANAINGIYDYAENAAGTSPSLAFARTLKQKLNVPIGIIPTAVGGTPLSFWNPKEDGAGWKNALRRFEIIDKVKGIIWFQGCSDREGDRAYSYLDRFKDAVKCWRQDLADESLPILTVQLNRWVSENKHDNDRQWGIIRDAQRRAALEIDNVYVVPSLDLGCSDGIHDTSASNVVIGQRLANAALASVYGVPAQTAPSVLSASYIDETHFAVNITPCHNVHGMDDLASGMNVEDENGLMECTTARPAKDALIVTTARAMSGRAYFHYAWRCQPPAFPAKDVCGMPLLACYNVEINK